MTKLNDVFYVQGLKGLYYLKGHNKGGIVVACCQTGARVAVPNSKMIGCLAYMSVETKSGKIYFGEVFEKMKAAGIVIGEKSGPHDLCNYFRMILPDYNEKLIHPSDIAKIIKWFSILDPIFDFNCDREKA